MNTGNSASTNLSDFWHSIGKESRLLHAACPALRADWDYIIGSGGSGEYRIAGGDSNAVVQFKALAKRAASHLADTNFGELVTGWLGALKREGINFEFGREGIETKADGSECVHLGGTIFRLFEASAIYCSILEGRALETELRALQQAAREPGPGPTGAADTPAQEHVGQAPRTMEQTPALEAGKREEVHLKPSEPATLIPDSPQMVAEEAITLRTTVTNRGKRGPKRDFETAMKVDDVVTRLAPDGNWRAQLEAICEGLDEAKVRCPKPWKVRGHRTWYDCMFAERPLVIKAIEHHRERAQEYKKTFS